MLKSAQIIYHGEIIYIYIYIYSKLHITYMKLHYNYIGQIRGNTGHNTI